MTTAIVICSYNMPEYTDALVEHIHETVALPYDLMVFDNGSDLVPPSKHTTYREPENIQMVPGFMKGLRLLTDEKKYDYYWLITTSVRFDSKDRRDPLAEMMATLEIPNTYTIQPALLMNYGARKRALAPLSGGIRSVHSLECSCPLYRADHFDRLGRWREELTYGWGFAAEIHYKARQDGLGIYNHDGYSVYKDTEVGYQMGRMKMGVNDRREAASAESDRVLGPIYGENWREILNNGFWDDFPVLRKEERPYDAWIETQVGIHGFIEKPEHYEISERRAIDHLFRNVHAGAAILDVGCGTGNGIRHLNSLGYENVTGIELSQPKAYFAGALQGDAGRFAFPRHYDVIYSSHSFEHAFEPEKTLGNLKRYMPRGAMLIVILPYPDTGDSGAHCASEELGLRIEDGGETVTRWFTDRGFELIDRQLDSYREPEIWLRLRRR